MVFNTAKNDPSKLIYKDLTPYTYTTWIPSSQPKSTQTQRRYLVVRWCSHQTKSCKAELSKRISHRDSESKAKFLSSRSHSDKLSRSATKRNLFSRRRFVVCNAIT